jgi:Carboxypeptidase regulatory-like domain
MTFHFSRSFSLVLLLGAALLVPTPSVCAQHLQPIPTFVALENLPDAPQPQSDAASRGSGDEQPVAGQVGSAKDVNDERESTQPPSSAQKSSTGFISGTVTDVNGGIVSGASIALDGAAPDDRQTAVSNDAGAFQFDNVKPGVQYHVTIAAKNLRNWESPALVLQPGQYFFLTDIRLGLPNSEVSVTVYATQEQIATEQVIVAEKQRVFGIIPNFFVTYDSHPVPLTTKLKYRLAFKSATDPVTFLGVTFMAAVYQAGDLPDYQQGWKGYAQRVGAGFADTTTDIFFGGAILPSLLHQDPRYFYQGTGTKKSRAFHALSSPYICKGDNGKTQPNISSLGGDLISGAISNLYYPETNRGVGLVFEGFAVTTAVRTVNALIQEFVLRKLTPSARQGN